MITMETTNDCNTLLLNLDKLHTTEMGINRIKKNLYIEEIDDVVGWCKEKIQNPGTSINRKGKNWYIKTDSCILTINAYSYTIITAHILKENE